MVCNMTRVIISGCNGHMGRVVADLCKAEADIQIVAGFDVNAVKLDSFPVYADPMEFTGEADCIIDFSSPKALPGLLRFCRARNCGVVLATTGYTPEDLAAIDEAAKQCRIFRSANMSLGINVVVELIRKAAQLLEGYDIEIVERHHNRKVDAPSGTALMLADAAASAVNYDAEYTYDRHSRRQARDPKEIGISAVRGGTIVGEHEIIFAGRDEVIEIRHSAMSREIFANGAVRAARFLAQQTAPGLYNMQQLVSEE
jgi:4-hydroxy-tetrahydrodipicolinate reductase